MKSIVSGIVLFFFILTSVHAQFIPNGDFESWSSATGNFLPVGWKSFSIQGDPNSIKATAPGYNSAQALRIAVKNVSGSYTHADLYQTIDIMERPISLIGAVWGNAASGDSLFICVKLYKNQQQIGEAIYVNTTYIATFTPFEVFFNYSATTNPDSAIIHIKNRINSGMASTFHMVDGLNLTGVTGINDKQIEESIRVFPNPSNGMVNISLNSEISETLRFQIIGLDGKVLSDRDLVLSGGEDLIPIDLEYLENGIYFYRLVAVDRQISGKLEILR